jgi:hypothetical protein
MLSMKSLTVLMSRNSIRDPSSSSNDDSSAMSDVPIEHTVTPVWINLEWLSWLGTEEDRDYVEYNDAARPYENHQHACDRLAGDPNNNDRVDAIMALRRAVGQRLKALMEIYELRELPIGMKCKNLELLSYFGLIRPFMLKRLIDLRDSVEHDNTSPPPLDECLMFADLIWYFLRSTDRLVKSTRKGLQFWKEPSWRHYEEWDDNARVWLRFGGPLSEPPEIQATLYEAYYAYEPKADWIRVEATQIEKYETLAEGGDEEKDKDWVPWMKVTGKISGTEEQMRLIYQAYFNVDDLL